MLCLWEGGFRKDGGSVAWRSCREASMSLICRIQVYIMAGLTPPRLAVEKWMFPLMMYEMRNPCLLHKGNYTDIAIQTAVPHSGLLHTYCSAHRNVETCRHFAQKSPNADKNKNYLWKTLKKIQILKFFIFLPFFLNILLRYIYLVLAQNRLCKK